MGQAWLSGAAPEEWRTGYTQLIRAPGDPEERATRGHGGTRHGRWGSAPGRVVAKMDPDVIVDVMLSVLGDDAMTFNALSVLAFDLTADVAFGSKINFLLWDLVEEKVLEHTAHAPILFRKRRPSDPSCQAVGWYERPAMRLRRCRSIGNVTSGDFHVETLCGYTITLPCGLSPVDDVDCEECLALSSSATDEGEGGTSGRGGKGSRGDVGQGRGGTGTETKAGRGSTRSPAP